MYKFISTFCHLVKADFSSGSFRFSLFVSIVNRFPGSAGAFLRTILLSKYIGTIGSDSKFLGDVTIVKPSNLHLGKNVLFNKDIYIQASGVVEIGDYSIFGPSVKIWSLNHNFTEPEAWIPEQGYEYSPVLIGKHVWVGANVFLMPGVELGDGCIVAAGAVVGKKKYPPYTILAGNPARKIGERPTADE